MRDVTRNAFYEEIFHECFEQKNAEPVTEFDRYVREHPDFAERIPDNALVAIRVKGDEPFNRWSQEGAKRYS
jgi:Family of unknown function (DUF5647)